MIDPVSAFKFCFFVNYWDGYLPVYSQIAEAKFMREAFLICRFKQSRTKALVDFDCRANDFGRDVVVRHGNSSESKGI